MRLPERFRRFAGSAVGTYLAYVAHGLRHPSLLVAHATPRERKQRLVGDELVPDADWQTDFATTIHSSPEAIWPWLAQMGYGRAGYYTWYRYDNGGVGSADIIVPALQDVSVGGIIPDGPRAEEGYGMWRIVELAKQRALVLYSRRHPTTGREVHPHDEGPSIAVSWAFVLEVVDAETTRLHVRVRANYETIGGRISSTLARAIFGLGDNVMENTMLAGIRDRVEGAAA
jgi:hypothetical protein